MEYKIESQRLCSCVANCDVNPDKLFPALCQQQLKKNHSSAIAIVSAAAVIAAPITIGHSIKH